MKNCEKCGFDKVYINTCLKDKNGEITLCPNCRTALAATGELKLKNNPEKTCDITGKPGAVEFISGDEYYCINAAAMKRLLLYKLKPSEYLILAKKYGADKFMLHDDFYLANGKAIQPAI